MIIRLPRAGAFAIGSICTFLYLDAVIDHNFVAKGISSYFVLGAFALGVFGFVYCVCYLIFSALRGVLMRLGRDGKA